MPHQQFNFKKKVTSDKNNKPNYFFKKENKLVKLNFFFLFWKNMKNSEHSRHVVGVFVVIDTAKLQVQESETRWQERRIHYARAYMEAHELVSISCFCIAWCLGLAQTEWPQDQASAPEPIAAPAAAAGVSEEFGGDALGDE